MIRNGRPEMSRITGSGCMLTALMGACLGAVPEDPLGAAVGAQCIMNAAGEAAILKTRASAGGTMTFRMHLIDAVSLMKEEQLSDYQGFNAIPLCHL